jgi:alpha-1,2-mannosyltransferase
VGAPSASLDHPVPGQVRTGGLGRLVVRALLAAFVITGLFTLVRSGDLIEQQEPLDLHINMVAAERLVDGLPLYETDDSRARAIERGGEAMEGAYRAPTNSFVGPPSTALVHVPFTLFDQPTDVAVFRMAALVGMVGSLAIVALCLPRGVRLDGWLLGGGALLWATATVDTLRFGQGHELVMLGLAVAMWASSRERWAWAGAAIGVAAALKISPVLLLVYLLGRGHRSALWGFLASVSGLTAVAALVGRPGDLVTWVRDVAPDVSAGVGRTINQSLPAFLSRLSITGADHASTAPLGAIRLIGAPLVLGALVWLWYRRRGRGVDPMELGVLLLVGLVVGPLTWWHYATWACLPIVLLADPARWGDLSRTATKVKAATLGLGLVLLAAPMDFPSAAALDADRTLRLSSSPTLAAVVALLVVGALSLVDPDRAPDPAADDGRRPEHRTASA